MGSIFVRQLYLVLAGFGNALKINKRRTWNAYSKIYSNHDTRGSKTGV